MGVGGGAGVGVGGSGVGVGGTGVGVGGRGVGVGGTGVAVGIGVGVAVAAGVGERTAALTMGSLSSAGGDDGAARYRQGDNTDQRRKQRTL